LKLRRSGFLKFTLLCLLFLGLIVGWLGFGERGFIHLYRMEKERQTYLARIQKLEQENEALLEEIGRFRSEDTDYIESLIRKELGLVRNDEIIYRFSREQEQEEDDLAHEPGAGIAR